jgi:hypothetical protein
MAPLIIIIGHFFDEAHIFGKVMEMGKQFIYLMERSLYSHRYTMLCHISPLLSVHAASRDKSVAKRTTKSNEQSPYDPGITIRVTRCYIDIFGIRKPERTALDAVQAALVFM